MAETRLRSLEREAFMGNVEAQDRLMAERLRTRKVIYSLMDKAKTYALGKCALQDSASEFHPIHRVDGEWVTRPLTFKENLEAKLWMYKNVREEEKLTLFDSSNESCTAVVYKGGTTKFKIVSISKHLIGLERDFGDDILGVDYHDSAFAELQELDSTDECYHKKLKKEQVLTHPAWLAAVQDSDLLAEYVDIVFHEIKKHIDDRDKGMGFYVRNKPEEDQLEALSVGWLTDKSSANGDYGLGYIFGCFVHVTPYGSERK